VHDVNIYIYIYMDIHANDLKMRCTFQVDTFLNARGRRGLDMGSAIS
jgi:hypothetical protein